MFKNSVIFCGACLILLFSTVQSYENIDEGFNDLIMSIAESNLNGDASNIRRTRQAPGQDKKFDMNRCCNVETTAEQQQNSDSTHEMKEKCVREIFGDDKPGRKDRGKFNCVAECMGQKLGYVDASKNLKEDAFREYVKNSMAQHAHQKAVADEAVTKCLAKIKAPQDDESQEQDNTNGPKCNKNVMKLNFCIWGEFAKSCPTDKQDTSERCVKFRERIVSGKPPHGKRGPPRDEEEE